MTTGNTGSLPISPLTVGPDTLKRIWNGGDGKFEVISGSSRQKWNNFTCDVVGSNVTYPYFVFYHVWKPTGGTWLTYTAPGWNKDVFGFEDEQWYKPSYRPLSEALSKLLEEVKGHDFNLGVELAQTHQTVGLLAENLRKLGRAALALRRGDFATAARCLGAAPKGTRLKTSDISGRWLELQYGWLPLLSSSFEVCKAFEELTNGPRKVLFQVSKSRKAIWNLSTAPPDYSLLVEGKVRCRIQYELYEEMSFTRQLGLEDPLSIAWELTPWSFVVDWFLPFGNYLSLLNQIPKLKGRWLITDSLKVMHQPVVCIWKRDLSTINETVTNTEVPSFRYWYNKVRRTYQENPPGIPFPRLKQNWDTIGHFYNAVALAHQRFK